MLPNLSRLHVYTAETDADGDDGDSDGDGDALARILKAWQQRRLQSSRNPPRSRPSPSPQPSPPLPPQTPPPGPCPDVVFQPKKRIARLQLPPWRTENMLDFSFENPLDGAFKDLEVVKRLLSDFPTTVFERRTSYCHHEYDYRKRTVLVTTLPNFRPAFPCPGMPCAHIRERGSHPVGVANCEAAQKNSIPPKLIDHLIRSWKERPRSTDAPSIQHWVLIDVFHGFGSVKKRVYGNPEHADVKVYSNDLVDRPGVDATLDMRIFGLDTLLALALTKIFPNDAEGIQSHPGGAIGWCSQERIAVLFHLSTPCETYSVQGLGKHRAKGTTQPQTKAAQQADDMNAKLIAWLRTNALPVP